VVQWWSTVPVGTGKPTTRDETMTASIRITYKQKCLNQNIPFSIHDATCSEEHKVQMRYDGDHHGYSVTTTWYRIDWKPAANAALLAWADSDEATSIIAIFPNGDGYTLSLEELVDISYGSIKLSTMVRA